MSYSLEVLRYGMKGSLVSVWQEFLQGENLYMLSIDSKFGPGTLKATKLYEKRNNIRQDGVVDDQLWGLALSNGLCLAGSRYKFPDMPDFPPLNYRTRSDVLGVIQYKAAPTPNNREAIRITNNWQRENLTTVVIPQLRGVRGAPSSGKIFWHKKGVDQILGFFDEVEQAGLKDRILTWAGSWVPRFVRNRPGVLSNHAYASAFDINATWNWLGRNAAPIGSKGSVMELVPIAVNHGFYWGGWFNHELVNGETVKKPLGRSDAMHFELAKIL